MKQDQHQHGSKPLIACSRLEEMGCFKRFWMGRLRCAAARTLSAPRLPRSCAWGTSPEGLQMLPPTACTAPGRQHALPCMQRWGTGMQTSFVGSDLLDTSLFSWQALASL